MIDYSIEGIPLITRFKTMKAGDDKELTREY